MITYLNKITDTSTHQCTAEIWEKLIATPPNKQYIEMYRETGNVKWKQLLPAVNFHGYDPKVLKGLDGSRKQSAMQPTGLFMLDVDHVANPKLYWEKLCHLTPEGGTLNGSGAKTSAEGNKDLPLGGIEGADIALVHITPSGEGLRIVMKGRPGSNIKDDQKWLADILGVKHDECTKDLSRWSFVPSQKDILYINPQILFANAEETSYNSPLRLPRTGESPSAEVSDSEGNVNPSPRSGGVGGGLFPSTYHGIPYTKIVETLIQYHGGTPEYGERHQTIITLANDLKTITDGNVDWLLELIPTFGKPHSEKRSAIAWAVQHQTQGRSRALNSVIDHLQNGTPLKTENEDNDEETEFQKDQEKKQAIIESIPNLPDRLPNLVELLTSKVMPFQKPAVAQMVFPALAAHVGEATFISTENKKYELSLMGVLVGKQSVGKGCIDAPIEEIIADIEAEDERAREEERSWSESQQNKSANDHGEKRPQKPIRILNSDVTPAALLQRLYSAQHYGDRKDLRCFTKVEEIEELYNMAPVSGRNQITQLIKKTWDVGRIGSERYSSNSANFSTMLRWNWVAACTADKARAFFGRSLTDGTLSRVDFATMIAPEEDFDFIYGLYDEQFQDALKPYIDALKAFRCETSASGRRVPFRLPQLDELELKANRYIKNKAKEMADDTWISYAWRTKFIAMKKILILYIANGGRWEDCFEDFFFWSFDYSMWVKMNLYYEKARDAFSSEEVFAAVSVKSPLELVGTEFTKDDMKKAMEECGCKTYLPNYLAILKHRKKIVMVGKDSYRKL